MMKSAVMIKRYDATPSLLATRSRREGEIAPSITAPSIPGSWEDSEIALSNSLYDNTINDVLEIIFGHLDLDDFVVLYDVDFRLLPSIKRAIRNTGYGFIDILARWNFNRRIRCIDWGAPISAIRKAVRGVPNGTSHTIKCKVLDADGHFYSVGTYVHSKVPIFDDVFTDRIRNHQNITCFKSAGAFECRDTKKSIPVTSAISKVDMGLIKHLIVITPYKSQDGLYYAFIALFELHVDPTLNLNYHSFTVSVLFTKTVLYPTEKNGINIVLHDFCHYIMGWT